MKESPSLNLIIIGILLIFPFMQCRAQEGNDSPKWNEKIQAVLDNTSPLEHERGSRLPLYLWSFDPGFIDEETAEILIKELDARGIGLVCTWQHKNLEQTLSSCMTVARVQKKLGLRININATPLLNSFFNGDMCTAHIDDNGKAFFDQSFPSKQDMGCPFAIDHRKNEIRERVVYYLDKYKAEGLSVDFIVADWEIDGPLEVNKAYEASQKCARCKEYLSIDFGFPEFQKVVREMRSYLQYYVYASPVLAEFPEATIGNYAVYPCDGFRYWYDYFEYFVEYHPHKTDQNAEYRAWYNDFPSTGYNCAMPIVYTWFPIYDWYDFDNPDYRWFYNMLLVASNAGKSTPQSIPIVSFVTWNTVWVSVEQKMIEPDPEVKQLSMENYQELLWHMLLRGTDDFYMYSSRKNYAEEVRLVHEVYAAAQEFGDFLEYGLPVNFDVPNEPGTIVSGLALKDRVLVRRTDFGSNREPVEIMAGTKFITVEYKPGSCQIIEVD